MWLTLYFFQGANPIRLAMDTNGTVYFNAADVAQFLGLNDPGYLDTHYTTKLVNEHKVFDYEDFIRTVGYACGGDYKFVRIVEDLWWTGCVDSPLPQSLIEAELVIKPMAAVRLQDWLKKYAVVFNLAVYCNFGVVPRPPTDGLAQDACTQCELSMPCDACTQTDASTVEKIIRSVANKEFIMVKPVCLRNGRCWIKAFHLGAENHSQPEIRKAMEKLFRRMAEDYGRGDSKTDVEYRSTDQGDYVIRRPSTILETMDISLVASPQLSTRDVTRFDFQTPPRYFGTSDQIPTTLSGFPSVPLYRRTPRDGSSNC